MQLQDSEQDDADLATARLLGAKFYQFISLDPVGWWVMDSSNQDGIQLTSSQINTIGEHPTEAACARAFIKWYAKQPQKVTP
jgi:hypothetical protein